MLAIGEGGVGEITRVGNAGSEIHAQGLAGSENLVRKATQAIALSAFYP